MEYINTVRFHPNGPNDPDEQFKVWAVFSTVPERDLAAAFYEREDAFKLHEHLAESEEPILTDFSSVFFIIDELKSFIRNGDRPYTIVLENGHVLREDTYESETFNLRKPGFEAGRPDIFAGTYWAHSIQSAVAKAQSDWKTLRK